MTHWSLSDAELVDHCRSGELVSHLNRWDLDETKPGSILARCVDLHNAGQLDFLGLVNTAQFAALGGTDFFAVQHAFIEVIPLLDSSPSRVMAAVKVLVEKGGNDGAANLPNAALQKWCAKDLSRANLIIDLAEQGDELARQHLTFALEALGSVSAAREHVTKYSDDRRLSGISALGRMKPDSQDTAEQSALLLLPLVEDSQDEQTRCNALLALFNICEPFPVLAAKIVPKTTSAALGGRSDLTRRALLRAVWLHPKLFDAASLRATLDGALTIEPALPGFLHELDLAINTQLKLPHAHLAIDFLTEISGREEGTVELEKLQMVKHTLASGDRSELLKLVVRWLLTGNLNLCDSASKLLRSGEREQPFTGDLRELSLSDGDHQFLAHKAIGFFFVNPVIAASILVASIRSVGDDLARQLSGLLFDPLLVNYGGEARDYLRTIKNGDPAYKWVRIALRAADKYVRDLKSAGAIKELQPSAYERNAQGRRAWDMMNEIREQADKQSVLLNLVHRSTLLYGRKSLTFVSGPDNKRRPVAMDLHSFSHSIEMPRMDIIDPLGLDYMLRVFRVMKRK